MNWEELSGKSVLLLGKTRALYSDEFDTLLKLHKIERVSRFDEGVAVIIEGRMMNPYEQAESARLYEEVNIPIVELSSIEEWLCRSIESNRLLMSLKLSRNQERLVNFLQNPYITDELFYKLLKLYDWQNEGLFDNDMNRDVTASIIGRFYGDLDRNHNVQYAMSGLAHLIEQYGNTELIRAIAELSPIAKELSQLSDRSLFGVLDAMALHHDTPIEVLRKLLPTHERLLAVREPLVLEAELMERGEVGELLAQNPTLSASGRQTLLARYPALSAQYAQLDSALFEALVDTYPSELGSNRSLESAMQSALMALRDEMTFTALAANPNVEQHYIKTLLEWGGYNAALASNPSLNQEDLESLYATNDPEVHAALAANTATPVEMLYQLSLDRRFERAVKTNPSFGKHIQTHNIGWY